MMNKIKMVFILTLIIGAVFIPSVKAMSYPWWNNTWEYKTKLTIDSSKIDVDLTDLPILIHLNSTRINWAHVQDDLDDIRFIDSTETTVLKSELAYYTINNEAWIWVKVPVVTDAFDTNFYIYYGNIVAVSAWNPENVFETSNVMTQHLDSIVVGKVLDSTSNNNDGTLVGAVHLPTLVAGKIGNAILFDAIDNKIDCGNAVSLQLTAAITVSMWMKTGVSQDAALIEKVTAAWLKGWSIYPRLSNKIEFSIEKGVAWGYTPITTTSSYNDNIWHHIVGVFDGMNRLLYVDAVLEANDVAVTPDMTSVNNVVIGHSLVDGGYFNGIVDEVRIYNRALSVAEIKANYYSDIDTLLTYNLENHYSDAGSNGEIIILFILIPAVALLIVFWRRR